MKRLIALPAVAALISIAIGCSRQAPNAMNVAAAMPQQGRLVDIDGSVHEPFGNPLVRAVVLVFIVPDCPIANSYAPELNRIYAEYEPRGARMYLIQVDPQLSIEDARTHANEYQLRPPVVLDAAHAWVKMAGATKTPEAVVLSPDGELLYLGRIDDRYADLGQRREQSAEHELRDALDAVLAGRPVQQRRSTAVGCIIPDPN